MFLQCLEKHSRICEKTWTCKGKLLQEYVHKLYFWASSMIFESLLVSDCNMSYQQYNKSLPSLESIMSKHVCHLRQLCNICYSFFEGGLMGKNLKNLSSWFDDLRTSNIEMLFFSFKDHICTIKSVPMQKSWDRLLFFDIGKNVEYLLVNTWFMISRASLELLVERLDFLLGFHLVCKQFLSESTICKETSFHIPNVIVGKVSEVGGMLGIFIGSSFSLSTLWKFTRAILTSRIPWSKT